MVAPTEHLSETQWLCGTIEVQRSVIISGCAPRSFFCFGILEEELVGVVGILWICGVKVRKRWKYRKFCVAEDANGIYIVANALRAQEHYFIRTREHTHIPVLGDGSICPPISRLILRVVVDHTNVSIQHVTSVRQMEIDMVKHPLTALIVIHTQKFIVAFFTRAKNTGKLEVKV